MAYRVKKASRHRVTERVMTPIEALARLAAIVPPPRYPLLRFHGIIAPRHRWRDRVRWALALQGSRRSSHEDWTTIRGCGASRWPRIGGGCA